MKLSVLAVGRLRTPHFRQACDDYLGRLRRHHEPREIEVKDVDRAHGHPRAWRLKEATALLKARPRHPLIALDQRGRQWSSLELARWMADQRDAGVGGLAFVIGGPDGLDEKVLDVAGRSWSLGQLTLPHELARVVLLEQLYRAATLMAGVPYHR